MISPPVALGNRSILRWATELSSYLRSERVIAGHGVIIKQTNGGKTISATGSGIQFSGVAYVRGVKTSGLNSTSNAWVKVDIAAGTAVEDAGPPPNPFPDGVEYYEKAQTAGDIHVTRFG